MTEPKLPKITFTVGMSNTELAERLGLTEAEVVQAVHDYLQEYPLLAQYVERWRREHPAEAAADDTLRDSGLRPGADPEGKG